MNTIRKNSQGYGYKYTDLAEIHRYLDECGERYYQEVETIDGYDYILTHIFDATGKSIRKCRGCRIPPLPGGKNPAQEYGSALTYARRYSLLLAFGLATTDDDCAALTPVKPNKRAVVVKPDKPTKPCKVEESNREACIATVKRLIDMGDLQLADVQREVWKYGVEKMHELSHDDFIACIETLTKA